MTGAPAYPWEVAPTGPAAVLAGRLAELLPRLETPRTILRAPVLDDFPAYAEIMTTDRARYMDGPFDRQGAWLDFCQNAAGWVLRGSGLFTIVAKDTGEILGFITVGMEFGDHEPELGYFLLEKAEGRGIVTEAAEAAKAFALDELCLPALVSYIDPANLRSARVAERLGASRDAGAEAAFDDEVAVFRHKGPEGAK